KRSEQTWKYFHTSSSLKTQMARVGVPEQARYPRSTRIRARDLKLDPSYTQTVAAPELCALHAFTVDVGAVRARQVDDFQGFRAGADAAVQPRDEGGVDDEIGARRTAHGLDGAGPDPECQTLWFGA